MDATRADVEFTAEVCQIAIDEGATTINIPDTVGYTMPHEYTAYLERLYELVPELRDVVAVGPLPRRPGAGGRQLVRRAAGRRAPGRVRDQRDRRARRQRLARGDRDAAAHPRRPTSACTPAIVTQEIARTRRLVSRLTGYPVQPNKAIVGRNAFAHESGIHQDGVLKERTTYEIMDATTVGLDANSIVLGKHSGRHALQQALAELGFEVCRPGAEHRVQALQGDRGQEEAGHRDGPRGAGHRRAARGDRGLPARVVRRRGLLAPAAARDGRRPHARRRGARRARSPATARSTRSSARSTPPPASTRSCASSASTRSPAARTRSARPRSCSSSAA